ncbi:MAG: sugar ABC transporter permease [Thermomicrobiales bacterium]
MSAQQGQTARSFAATGAIEGTLPAAVRRREAIWAYLLLSPAIILFLVFIAGPLIGAIVLSFYEWDLLTDARFIGTRNYRELMSDDKMWQSVRNTFVFAFWSLVLHIGFGLALALMVQRAIPGVLKYLFRTAVFFPVIMSWAAVSLIWLYILDPNYGFINYYLEQLGLPTKSWLLMPDTAMPSLILVDLWKTIGFTFILLLAGLQGVPEHLYEAAKIDGAGAVSRFFNVTVPMLSPTLFLTSVLTFIGAFQIFDPMFIMTGGGPLGRTTTVVLHIYQTGFKRFEMGYASAMAIIVFLIILAMTLIQMRLSRHWVFYD